MSKPKSKSKIAAKEGKKPTKKVVVTTTKKQVVTTKSNIAPTRSRRRTASTSAAVATAPLLFGKQNYILMGAGFGLILLGLLLMSGGAMPSPDVWDENIIYGFRRTVLAPILMVAGLVVEVIAIFKK